MVLFLCVDEVEVLKFSILVLRCCVVSWNELWVCVDGLKNSVYIVELVSMWCLLLIWLIVVLWICFVWLSNCSRVLCGRFFRVSRWCRCLEVLICWVVMVGVV